MFHEDLKMIKLHLLHFAEKIEWVIPFPSSLEASKVALPCIADMSRCQSRMG